MLRFLVLVAYRLEGKEDQASLMHLIHPALRAQALAASLDQRGTDENLIVSAPL